MLDSPNISRSRRSATLRPSRSSLKYQLPSTVSPYRQAPTSLSSLITSFLYDAAAKGSRMHDFLGVRAALEVARREQVDARHLELGGGQRALVAPDAEFGQVVGQHLALLEQRGHQAVGHAAVRGAFAHGVDARVGHRSAACR